MMCYLDLPQCGLLVPRFSFRTMLRLRVRIMPASQSPGNRRKSPLRILKLDWGTIEIEGAGTFRDAKLFPGGAREWNWHETGTEHVPGIQPADVSELLDKGATTVVLS
jgi:hypothetical protein